MKTYWEKVSISVNDIEPEDGIVMRKAELRYMDLLKDRFNLDMIFHIKHN